MAIGCAPKSAQQNPADIERAVKEYLAKKPGLSAESMQIEVRNVQFHGETADADVLFRSKANPEASMTMSYTLKRTGPGTWMVEGAKGSKAGQQGHPGMPAPDAKAPAPQPGKEAPPSATDKSKK